MQANNKGTFFGMDFKIGKQSLQEQSRSKLHERFSLAVCT
jgi:hypothetical protein